MSATNPAPMHEEFTCNLGSSRILLIGGEPGPSTSLYQQLAERNCVVDRAAGCADVLRRLRHASYDVVITDPATPIEEDLAHCRR